MSDGRYPKSNGAVGKITGIPFERRLNADFVCAARWENLQFRFTTVSQQEALLWDVGLHRL